MRPLNERIRLADNEADSIKSLVRDDSNHTARSDSPRDLRPGAGGA